MKFGARLKELREKKGYTQEEIAAKLNVARQSVSKWERGINEPDFDTTKQLCNILECSIAELIDPEGSVHEIAEVKKKRRIKWLLRSVIILTVFSSLLLLATILAVNDPIIIHWSLDGTATYGSKWNLLWILGLLLLCPLSLLMVKYPYPKAYKNRRLILAVMALVITILMVVIALIIVPLMIKDSFSGHIAGFNLIHAGFYALFLGLAPLTHPRFNRFNLMFGFRTNFTFSSEEVWNKVNAFAAISMTISTLLAYVFTLVFIDSELAMWSLAIFFSGLVVATVYHEVLRSRCKKQNTK
ncbi:MAG: helix-turn-helix domain-containing protein [Bacilli bacterium]